MEAKLQGELLGSKDNKEGIDAFFEKRDPNFKGE
jgi:enoyl-CoA hydratase/carnithine racemase